MAIFGTGTYIAQWTASYSVVTNIQKCKKKMGVPQGFINFTCLWLMLFIHFDKSSEFVFNIGSSKIICENPLCENLKCKEMKCKTVVNRI